MRSLWIGQCKLVCKKINFNKTRALVAGISKAGGLRKADGLGQAGGLAQAGGPGQ
jgi:hypothetical protein